ncbi:MAG TPA: hypothetical protein PLZ51_20855, partial [Aggregatilineales bacterium]|nr:hypothetical protein [Aggregatilineales bacterium]
EAIGHSIYTIFEYITDQSTLLPKGTNILNIRHLVEFDPPNEQLVIFIREDSLTRSLLTILAKVYSMNQLINKYRFVHTWDEAMAQIEAHKTLMLA